MTKKQFKEWFITTDPRFPICDDIQGLTRNDGSPAFQCCSPDGMVILSDEEMQECYEARWEAWNKKNRITMKLEYYKDYICIKDAPKPCLTISKAALEKARDHYTEMIEKFIALGDDYSNGMYAGKRNLVNELLALFEAPEPQD